MTQERNAEIARQRNGRFGLLAAIALLPATPRVALWNWLSGPFDPTKIGSQINLGTCTSLRRSPPAFGVAGDKDVILTVDECPDEYLRETNTEHQMGSYYWTTVNPAMIGQTRIHGYERNNPFGPLLNYRQDIPNIDPDGTALQLNLSPLQAHALIDKIAHSLYKSNRISLPSAGTMTGKDAFLQLLVVRNGPNDSFNPVDTGRSGDESFFYRARTRDSVSMFGQERDDARTIHLKATLS